MKTIQYSCYGSPDVLELVDLPAPVPAPDEALIAVQCASVIPGDWKVRAGHLQEMFPLELPTIPGRDGAGIVVATGPDCDWANIGDALCFVTEHVEPGSYAEMVARPRRMTPLGGDRERGSHKGYGLAVMVDILSSVLTGSWFGAHDLKTGKTGKHHMIGSFFLALDPDMFRDSRGDFDADMAALVDFLKSTPPLDPDQPVMVAGEPERIAKAEREKAGIPVSDKLFEELRIAAESSGTAFLLGN